MFFSSIYYNLSMLKEIKLMYLSTLFNHNRLLICMLMLLSHNNDFLQDIMMSIRYNVNCEFEDFKVSYNQVFCFQN